MKRLLLCILVMTPFVVVSAQTDVESLLSGDKVWTMRYHLVLGPNSGDIYKFSKFRLADETIINDIPFRRVQFRNSDDGENYPDEWKDASFSIGQDGEKVYMKYVKDDYIFTIMDFSLKKGDTFLLTMGSEPVYYDFIVKEVTDTILVNSTDKTPRKCLHLGVGGVSGWDEVWVEGIGSLIGGLEGAAIYCKVGSYPNLMSCTDNDKLLFEYGDVNNITQPLAEPSSISGNIFNLQGQRLESVPQKGIYIQNGKKYVAK